jgi:hypothetical protein
VSGAENNVGQSVTAFKVVGSRNTIGEGSKNITIFGNDNEVIGGLHNVQLINTNGVLVTEFKHDLPISTERNRTTLRYWMAD